MRKTISLFLLAAFACAGTTYAETYSGACGAEGNGTNLTWTFDTETHILAITGTGAMKDYSSEQVPWYYYYDLVETVSLAEGMTSIGINAFRYCANLTEITIPNSVITIGDGAFTQCSKLATVVIGEGVKEIGKSAFNYCTSLSSLTFGGSVETIGSSAFSSCYKLTSVTLPNTVTTIGNNAFTNCSNISDITFGERDVRAGRRCRLEIIEAVVARRVPVGRREMLPDISLERIDLELVPHLVEVTVQLR